MGSYVSLGARDLAIAAVLVLGVAGLSRATRLGVERRLVVAALRALIQLLLIGLVLRALFATVHLGFLAGVALAMLLAAGREVRVRQRRAFRGAWGFSVGALSMFVSSFSVAVLALVVIVRPEPWYTPQYAIPLLGMLLGNTMTGVSLATDRLTDSVWRERALVEQRLVLGLPRAEAVADLRRESLRSGLMPIVNAMAAAGVVSLPGMMTGQILAGSSPVDAVLYQILILFLISGGTGLGTVVAVTISTRRLFDDRHRLRLERLHPPRA